MEMIKETLKKNDQGKDLYYAIYKDEMAHGYRFIAPGAYPRRFKTLKAAEKAMCKALSH